MIDTEPRPENPPAVSIEPATDARGDVLAYDTPAAKPAGMGLANVAALLAALSVPLTLAVFLGASPMWLALLLAGPTIGVLVAHDRNVAGRAQRRARSATLWAIALPFVAGTVLMVVTPSAGGRASEKANRVKCAYHLRQIGEALNAYSLAHGGQYPPTFDELFLTDPFGADGPLPWMCPSSPDERPRPINGTPAAQLKDFRGPGHNSYVYVIGGVDRSTITADHVIAHEDPTNHPDGMHVLFGDGRVKWLPARDANKLLAVLQAGRNPPRSTR